MSYQQEWHKKNPEKSAAYSRAYRERHPERVKLSRQKWEKNNREKSREAHRRLDTKLKNDTLSHYGLNGQLQCSWEGCQITDPDMLELDHINNDGKHQRKKDVEVCGQERNGLAFYRRLRKEKFPPGYQTLCCNHNRKKEILRRRGQ